MSWDVCVVALQLIQSDKDQFNNRLVLTADSQGQEFDLFVSTESNNKMYVLQDFLLNIYVLNTQSRRKIFVLVESMYKV